MVISYFRHVNIFSVINYVLNHSSLFLYLHSLSPNRFLIPDHKKILTCRGTIYLSEIKSRPYAGFYFTFAIYNYLLFMSEKKIKTAPMELIYLQQKINKNKYSSLEYLGCAISRLCLFSSWNEKTGFLSLSWSLQIL